MPKVIRRLREEDVVEVPPPEPACVEESKSSIVTLSGVRYNGNHVRVVGGVELVDACQRHMQTLP
jgi:hypothetical protein